MHFPTVASHAARTTPLLRRTQVSKTATFCAIYIHNASFCQDRLGTNIGKTPKKRPLFLRRFPAGSKVFRLLPSFMGFLVWKNFFFN
jgi:hypothetical protein